MTQSHLTKFGLPGIDTVPYGIHMCQLYDSRQDLIEGLKLYFLAGLNNNERCIWIAAAPMPTSEIIIETRNEPAFQRALESGQLTVMDTADWYGEMGSPDHQQVIQKWFTEEEEAIENGFRGLRLTGNSSSVEPHFWNSFMKYEKKFHEQVRNRRIVACCSYGREQRSLSDIAEAVQHHHGFVEQNNGVWEITRTPFKH